MKPWWLLKSNRINRIKPIRINISILALWYMQFDRLVSGVRCQVSELSLAAGLACLIEKNYDPAANFLRGTRNAVADT